MDYKKEMLKVLDELKKKNHSRRKIEHVLGYGNKVLDQILYQGGNETALNKLLDYKRGVDDGRITSFNGHVNGNDSMKILMPEFKAKNEVVQSASIKAIFQHIAKIESKIYGISIQDALEQLDQDTNLVIDDIQRKMKAMGL
jgi:hypothetical protein